VLRVICVTHLEGERGEERGGELRMRKE
jgi:hypothetical protein